MNYNRREDVPDEVRRFVAYAEKRLDLVQLRAAITLLKRVEGEARKSIAIKLVEYWEGRIDQLVCLPHSKHPELFFRLLAIDDDLLKARVREVQTGRVFRVPLLRLGNVQQSPQEAPIEESKANS